MILDSMDIHKYLSEIDEYLKTVERIKFIHSIDWANANFNKRPGVYAIFDDGELVYIGESANLQKRMKDMRNTYNHTFRKKVGRYKLKYTLQKNGKFLPHEEDEVTKYFEENIEITFYEIGFGRLEVESYLIHTNYEDENSKLINKIGKRDLEALNYLINN